MSIPFVNWRLLYAVVDCRRRWAIRSGVTPPNERVHDRSRARQRRLLEKKIWDIDFGRRYLQHRRGRVLHGRRIMPAVFGPHRRIAGLSNAWSN